MKAVPIMKNPIPELENLHKFSFNNDGLILATETVGCFYCWEIYPSKEIDEYADKGKTAVCPRCHIDSVLPNPENALTKELLMKMFHYYFCDGLAYKMKDGRISAVVDEKGVYTEESIAAMNAELQAEEITS